MMPRCGVCSQDVPFLRLHDPAAPSAARQAQAMQPGCSVHRVQQAAAEPMFAWSTMLAAHCSSVSLRKCAGAQLPPGLPAAVPGSAAGAGPQANWDLW